MSETPNPKAVAQVHRKRLAFSPFVIVVSFVIRASSFVI